MCLEPACQVRDELLLDLLVERMLALPTGRIGHYKGVTIKAGTQLGSCCDIFFLFLSFCLSVYEAGKAVKKGMGGQYAATLYTPSMYGQPVYTTSLMNQPTIPLLPVPNGTGGIPPHNGYGRDYDNGSSGWILTDWFCDQGFNFCVVWLVVVFVQWARAPRCLCCRTKTIAVSLFFSFYNLESKTCWTPWAKSFTRILLGGYIPNYYTYSLPKIKNSSFLWNP